MSKQEDIIDIEFIEDMSLHIKDIDIVDRTYLTLDLESNSIFLYLVINIKRDIFKISELLNILKTIENITKRLEFKLDTELNIISNTIFIKIHKFDIITVKDSIIDAIKSLFIDFETIRGNEISDEIHTTANSIDQELLDNVTNKVSQVSKRLYGNNDLYVDRIDYNNIIISLNAYDLLNIKISKIK